MDFTLVLEGQEDQDFLKLDKELNHLTLAPEVEDSSGLYLAHIKFYFVEFQALQARVPISSLVEDCKFSSIAFPSGMLLQRYVIGESSLTENIPAAVTIPDCGFKLEIQSYSVVAADLPGGLTLDELVTIDSSQKTFTVNKTTDLALLKQTVLFQLSASSLGYNDFSTMISISYETNGPSFDLSSGSVNVKPLTCS